MNFLAHIYLSGSNDEIKIGNFIADGVKGNSYQKYKPDIQTGILMHRDIDYFTDNHSISAESRNRIHEIYGKHSGIAIDIFYDHFLAKYWNDFSKESLRSYVYHFYFLALLNYSILPLRLKHAFPFMVLNNWFRMYSRVDGIENVLVRMSKFTSLPENTENAINNFKTYYSDYENEFRAFFKEIQSFISTKYKIDFNEK
ncbi:MAG: hypothetical protein A2046_13355 [Bacteroidetes bacterium GWA2_30_7]|nr:MAG: hypothetical protein A2046_13355 [Bacteroidetes bacterium GWA2_30_7]